MTMLAEEFNDLCIIPEFEHKWEFQDAENGNCYWKCSYCGRWTNEVEDSQP